MLINWKEMRTKVDEMNEISKNIKKKLLISQIF